MLYLTANLKLQVKDSPHIEEAAMKHKSRNEEVIRPATQSSVSVSGEVVCEDEACIGKEVKAGEPWPPDQPQPEKNVKRSADTSMSLGGKEACSDDACIGKK